MFKRAVLYGLLIIAIGALLLYTNDIQREAAYLYATIGTDGGEKKAEVEGFLYTDFENEKGILHERRGPGESGSKYWWLNSGGEFIVENGIGQTIQNELERFSRWRVLYNITNPLDTDNGYHPQNIFRLVSRSKWKNVLMEVQFRIIKDNQSSSPNRNESNGILLMSRYEQNGQTFYYAGLRVDGGAVIKKKVQGEYETLAYEKVLNGTYDRESNSNLIPKNKWIGLRMITQGTDQGTHIQLYWRQQEGEWEKLLETIDAQEKAIETKNHVGIRTDFMDVQLDSIKIEEIE